MHDRRHAVGIDWKGARPAPPSTWTARWRRPPHVRAASRPLKAVRGAVRPPRLAAWPRSRSLGNAKNRGYQVPALVRAGHRVVVADARGHEPAERGAGAVGRREPLRARAADGGVRRRHRGVPRPWLKAPTFATPWYLGRGAAVLVCASVIATTGFVPGVDDPEAVLGVVLARPASVALPLLRLAFVAAFAGDLDASPVAAPRSERGRPVRRSSEEGRRWPRTNWISLASRSTGC